jgi:hypothetical protein
MTQNATQLANTILAVAAKATALANQRATLTYQRSLGPSTDALLTTLGLSFPTDLVTEPEDTNNQGVMR